MERHRVDADLVPTFYFDADADSDPAYPKFYMLDNYNFFDFYSQHCQSSVLTTVYLNFLKKYSFTLELVEIDTDPDLAN